MGKDGGGVERAGGKERRPARDPSEMEAAGPGFVFARGGRRSSSSSTSSRTHLTMWLLSLSILSREISRSVVDGTPSSSICFVRVRVRACGGGGERETSERRAFEGRATSCRHRARALKKPYLEARLLQRHDLAVRLVLGLVHLAVRPCVWFGGVSREGVRGERNAVGAAAAAADDERRRSPAKRAGARPSRRRRWRLGKGTARPGERPSDRLVPDSMAAGMLRPCLALPKRALGQATASCFESSLLSVSLSLSLSLSRRLLPLAVSSSRPANAPSPIFSIFS